MMEPKRENEAPGEPHGYERWVGPVWTDSVSQTRWVLLITAAVAAAVAIGAVVLLRVTGLVPALAVLISGVTLMAAYVFVWSRLTAATHRALVARADLGDYRRLGIFLGVFLSFPVATIVLPLALILAFSR